MSDFHVVDYQRVTKGMSPQLKENFLNASLLAGISEDDCIHPIVACQAELLSRGFETQTKSIKALLDRASTVNRFRWFERIGLLAAGILIGVLITWMLASHQADVAFQKALQADSIYMTSSAIQNGELTIRIKAKPHESTR